MKQQQDFWKWAESRATRQTDSANEGKLDLSELPPDLRLSVPEIQQLHDALATPLGGADLAITDNLRRMVSINKKNGRHRLRLHHMFVGCDEKTIAALVCLAENGDGVEGARAHLKDYVDHHRDKISYDVDPEDLQSEGEHHDLGWILDKWRNRIDDDRLENVVITWGRYGRGSRTIRFGSYDFDRDLIRVHPALDQEWVPEFFVEFIVYHELLHALYPPQKASSSRRVVHTEQFRRMEQKFPRYEEALAWERNNLPRFLED